MDLMRNAHHGPRLENDVMAVWTPAVATCPHRPKAVVWCAVKKKKTRKAQKVAESCVPSFIYKVRNFQQKCFAVLFHISAVNNTDPPNQQ